MDPHVSEAWVGRVLAWHHKHPLARRLRRADVQGLGYVDLPYAAADGAPRARWSAAFSEDFLPPHPPARIAAWARTQGAEQAPNDAWPRRPVAIDRRLLPPEGQALHLWVGTAALETPAGTVRVLVSPKAPHAVLGRRLLSRPRMAAASLALLLLLLALPLGAWRQHRLAQLAAAADDDEPPVALVQAVATATAVPHAALAAPAEHAASDARPEPAGPTGPTGSTGQSPGAGRAPAEAPAVAVAASTPAPGAAASAAVGMPTLRALIDDDARAQARRAVAQARRQRVLQQVARGQAAWAVAGAHKRTPGESELLLPLLDAAADAADGARCGHAEVLPAGDEFRAVCWPFARREDAERVREVLAARGQAAHVVEF